MIVFGLKRRLLATKSTSKITANGTRLSFLLPVVSNYEINLPPIQPSSQDEGVLTAAKLAATLDIPSVHPAGVPENARVRCYNCGQIGHLSYDCQLPQVRKACYACGMTGHLSRECPTVRRPAFCFKCRLPGHVAAVCPTGNEIGTDTTDAGRQ